MTDKHSKPEPQTLATVIESEWGNFSGALGIVSSPSTTIEIAIDITEESKHARALGQMVYTLVKEDGEEIVSIGQITSVETKNRWHEDLSFKGVIKKHGALPNLSGAADNRLAKISIQSSFKKKEPPEPHILGASPSTGIEIVKVTDAMMSALVRHQREAVTYIGRAFGADVHMPMWFKHFGQDKFGARDAYHVGVFGKTGSGKTVASSLMLLGYAKNKEQMNILVLDPQGQFTKDYDLLPGGKSLRAQIELAGMKHSSFNLVNHIRLPEDYSLFGDLLVGNRFIRQAFAITTDDKQDAMRESIVSYLNGRSNNPSFRFERQDSAHLLRQMLECFVRDSDKYIGYVYSTNHNKTKVKNRIEEILAAGFDKEPFFSKWNDIFRLFSGENKQSMDDLVKKIVADRGGNFVVLDLSPGPGKIENENLQALFLRVIENKITEAGGRRYAEGKRANCLIVMDEAHRFIAKSSPDPRVRELTPDLVDAVRTTRKYGIGHMFITQSLESLDDEVIKQMRIFAFGHGLTIGAELRKVNEIVNSKSAIDLYKSFVDPSFGKYPFMFFGPVSPLSATGSPLFVEMYTDFADFEKKNTFSDE